MDPVWLDLTEVKSKRLRRVVYAILPFLTSQQLESILEQDNTLLSDESWLDIIKDFDKDFSYTISNVDISPALVLLDLLKCEEEQPKLLSSILQDINIIPKHKLIKYPSLIQLQTLLNNKVVTNTYHTQELLKDEQFKKFNGGKVHLNKYVSDLDTTYYILNNPLMPGLGLSYIPRFYSLETSTSSIDIISNLFKTTFYPKRQFNAYIKPPQVTSSKMFFRWFSDLPNAVYNFSKSHLNGFDPTPLPLWLDDIRKDIEDFTKQQYNSVLVNFYPDGSTSLSAHSDAELWLGHEFDVPSLSFGDARDIIFKQKRVHPNTLSSVKLTMSTNSLTLMQGRSTQEMWTHEIPKRTNVKWRFNLTFRQVYPKLVSKNPLKQVPEQMIIMKEEAIVPQEFLGKFNSAELYDFYEKV